MSSLPLSGIRVIDLSHSWAAPHCARILGDFGAEVIKVEYQKRLCILRGGKKENKHYDHHPAWHQINRSKLGITLDLKCDEDRDILRDLVGISDVVVENSRTMVLDRLGFGYEQMAGIKKDIIMLSMSAFGHTGPYSKYVGYGAIFEAVGGIQSLTAYGDGERPQRIKELDVTNGITGACAVMTALIHRQATGRGQHIDLSQLESATHATIGEHLLEYAVNGTQVKPKGNRHRHYAPQGCYRCKGEDAWVTITIRTEEEWQRFCQVAGHSEWLGDYRFSGRKARRVNHDELDRKIESWTKELGKHEIMNLLQGESIPAGAVFDMDDLNRDPHLKDRQYFSSDVDENGKRFMGMPFQLSGVKAHVRKAGPNLGEHNIDILTTLLDRSVEDVKNPDEHEIGTAFDIE